jgi:hypothetical protein
MDKDGMQKERERERERKLSGFKDGERRDFIQPAHRQTRQQGACDPSAACFWFAIISCGNWLRKLSASGNIYVMSFCSTGIILLLSSFLFLFGTTMCLLHQIWSRDFRKVPVFRRYANPLSETQKNGEYIIFFPADVNSMFLRNVDTTYDNTQLRIREGWDSKARNGKHIFVSD